MSKDGSNSNQFSIESILDMISNKGLSFVIVVVLLLAGNKYLNMKLGQLEQDFDHKISLKGYSLRGSVKCDTLGSLVVYQADLELVRE